MKCAHMHSPNHTLLGENDRARGWVTGFLTVDGNYGEKVVRVMYITTKHYMLVKVDLSPCPLGINAAYREVGSRLRLFSLMSIARPLAAHHNIEFGWH